MEKEKNDKTLLLQREIEKYKKFLDYKGLMEEFYSVTEKDDEESEEL